MWSFNRSVLAPPRRLGRDVPEGLRRGPPGWRFGRHEPRVLGRRSSTRSCDSLDRLDDVVGAARRDPHPRARRRRRPAGQGLARRRSRAPAGAAAATTSSRVRYLMADYSPHVLARASERVAAYATQVESLELDFRNPMHGLVASARQGALRAHLQPLRQPPDRRDHARRRRRLRAARARQHHAATRSRSSPRSTRSPQDEIVARIQQSCATGPRPLGDPRHGRALLGRRLGRGPPRGDLRRDPVRRRRCASRRAPRLTSTSCSTTCPSGRACTPRPSRWRASRRRWCCCTTRACSSRRTSSSASSASTPRIAVRASSRARSSTGSTGPIFQLVGERRGFSVDVEPFAYREGSNTAVLTARHRDTHRIALGTETTTEDAGLAPAAA